MPIRAVPVNVCKVGQLWLNAGFGLGTGYRCWDQKDDRCERTEIPLRVLTLWSIKIATSG